jgi:hypothetical protein
MFFGSKKSSPKAEASAYPCRDILTAVFGDLSNDQSLIDGKELKMVRFSLIEKLDANGDGMISRDEFVDRLEKILIHAGPETRTKLSRELITLVARVHKLRFERHAAAERTRAIEREQRDAEDAAAKGGCGIVRGYSCCELKDCCELDEAESCELATVHVKSTALEAVVV